jgi:hypothetical protein
MDAAYPVVVDILLSAYGLRKRRRTRERFLVSQARYRTGMRKFQVLMTCRVSEESVQVMKSAGMIIGGW